MADKLQTSIILNLAGNLDSMAKKYGAAFDNMGKRAQTGFGIVKRSAGVAIDGLDKLGNRYSAIAASAGSAVVFKGVADFSKIMTRLGTDTSLTREQVEALKSEITDVASSKDINVDRAQLAEAVSALLGRTGDFEFVQKNIKNLGLAIQGFGADAQDSGFLFEAMFNQGIRESADVEKMMDRLLMQFSKGSISVKELAKESPKLFALLRSGGEQAMTKMGALFQVFAKTKGSAAEVTTAVEAVFRVLSDKSKIAQLENSGIAVYTDASKKKMRDQFDILMDIMKASDHLGDRQLEALSGLFDETALSGIRALMNKENVALYDELINGAVKFGATQEASAKNAGELAAVLTGLRVDIEQIADEELTEPLKEFAAWLKTIDRDMLKMLANMAIGIAGVVLAAKTAKSVAGAYSWVRSTSGHILNGPKGKGQGPGAGAMDMLGAAPVYVVNMPGSGMGGLTGTGGLGDGGGKGGKGQTKGKSGMGMPVAAGRALWVAALYPIVEPMVDAAIGDTGFAKWAKDTDLDDVTRAAGNVVGIDDLQFNDVMLAANPLTGSYKILSGLLDRFSEKEQASKEGENPPLKAEFHVKLEGESLRGYKAEVVKAQAKRGNGMPVQNGYTMDVIGG
ncbi:phage tail tape measure protein [Shewanella algae]|uniref:phage tail tape measure protein n=1 Tax=Shewanella algae TaxID=38313 RepID=UPI0031F5CB8E